MIYYIESMHGELECAEVNLNISKEFPYASTVLSFPVSLIPNLAQNASSPDVFRSYCTTAQHFIRAREVKSLHLY